MIVWWLYNAHTCWKSGERTRHRYAVRLKDERTDRSPVWLKHGRQAGQSGTAGMEGGQQRPQSEGSGEPLACFKKGSGTVKSARERLIWVSESHWRQAALKAEES